MARHRCHLSWARCPRLMVDPVRTPTVARVPPSSPDVAARKVMWDRCWPCRPTPGSVICKPSILHLRLEGYVGRWVFGRRCPARRYRPSVEGSQQVGMRSRLLEFSRRQYPTRVGPSRRHWNRRTQRRRAGVKSARSCSSNPCPSWAAPVSARPASWGCRTLQRCADQQKTQVRLWRCAPCYRASFRRVF